VEEATKILINVRVESADEDLETAKELKFKAKMQNKNVEKLRAYFENRDEVLMAFLFGSWAKGQEGIESDMDIAVYFKPKVDIVEWEETDSYYETEKQIWMEVERIVGREVDLLVLNRAVPGVADNALRGIPIIIKDRSCYMDFLLRITSEAIDFRQWVESYWRLKEQMKHGNITGR